jgi:hypothetical protein
MTREITTTNLGRRWPFVLPDPRVTWRWRYRNDGGFTMQSRLEHLEADGEHAEPYEVKGGIAPLPVC